MTQHKLESFDIKRCIEEYRFVLDNFLNPSILLDRMPDFELQVKENIMSLCDRPSEQVEVFLNELKRCDSPADWQAFLDALNNSEEQKWLYHLLMGEIPANRIERVFDHISNATSIKKLFYLIKPQLNVIDVHTCITVLSPWLADEEKQCLLKKYEAYGNNFTLWWLLRFITRKEPGWIKHFHAFVKEENYRNPSEGTLANLLLIYFDIDTDEGDDVFDTSCSDNLTNKFTAQIIKTADEGTQHRNIEEQTSQYSEPCSSSKTKSAINMLDNNNGDTQLGLKTTINAVTGKVSEPEISTSFPLLTPLKVGDNVCVTLGIDELKSLLVGHGGWHSKMTEVIGKPGKIYGITGRGDVRVRYNQSSNRRSRGKEWHFPPEALQRLSDKPGNEALGNYYATNGCSLKLSTSRLSLQEVEKLSERVNKIDVAGNPSSYSSIATSGNDRLIQKLIRFASSGNLSSIRQIPLPHLHDCVNQLHGGISALHSAAMNGNSLVLRYLLDQKGNVQLCDLKGETPLFHAIKGRALDAVTTLLNFGADVNKKNMKERTPLHLAVSEDFEAAVKLLLVHGADVNSQGCDLNLRNSSKQTPLHLSCLQLHLGIIELLVENGADLTSRDSANRSCVHILIQQSTSSSSEKLVPFSASKDGDKIQNIITNHNLAASENSCSLSLLLCCFLAINGASVDDVVGHKWRGCLLECQLVYKPRDTTQGSGVMSFNSRSEEEIARLKLENEQLRDERLCPICKDKDRDVSLPCGHSACRKCALRLILCCSCREPFNQDQLLPLFYS